MTVFQGKTATNTLHQTYQFSILPDLDSVEVNSLGTRFHLTNVKKQFDSATIDKI